MSPITCNGPRIGAPEYSAVAVMYLKPIIQEVRKYFVIPDGGAAGVRFNNDDLVLLSIRSNATEEAAMLAPLSWAHAALEDCASRDFYYAVEKEYASPSSSEAEAENALLENDEHFDV